MWRVTVSDACVGSGMCIGIAARHFQLDDDDRSQPIHAQLEPDESVLDAALSCPMEAIRITDADTDAEVFDIEVSASAPAPRESAAADGTPR